MRQSVEILCNADGIIITRDNYLDYLHIIITGQETENNNFENILQHFFHFKAMGIGADMIGEDETDMFFK